MTSADDTASHFAMTSAELLNGMAFLLSRERSPGDAAQASDIVALLRKRLREQVALIGSMRPGRISGPENFDITTLAAEADKLATLLDGWKDPAGAVPHEIRACALRVMQSMGFRDAQLAAFMM